MSPARVGAAISEAELIEIENRASALQVAAGIIDRRIFSLDYRKKHVPWTLYQAQQRIVALRDDVRCLIELARERGGGR